MYIVLLFNTPYESNKFYHFTIFCNLFCRHGTNKYYSRTNETDGTSYLIITTIVDDPMYLAQPFITSTHFKMEPNGAKWMPSACEAK